MLTSTGFFFFLSQRYGYGGWVQLDHHCKVWAVWCSKADLVFSSGIQIHNKSIKKQSGTKIGYVFDTDLSRGLSPMK